MFLQYCSFQLKHVSATLLNVVLENVSYILLNVVLENVSYILLNVVLENVSYTLLICPTECFFHIANLYDGAFSVKEARDLIRHTDPHAPIDCTWQIDVEDVSKVNNIELKFSQPFKGSGNYWYLLKIIISIKPYLVTSNGERLIVQNIVKNGSSEVM